MNENNSQWTKTRRFSRLRLWMNECYNSTDEGGDVAEVIREAFTDITEQLNGLRKVSYCVPDTHCAVDGLCKHTNTNICKQSVSLSLIYSLTILELRPCKDSASCSLWCEKETSSVAASNIYRSIHSWTHNTTKTDGSKSGALLRASQVCCWCCGAKTARCSGHQSSAVTQRNVSLPVSCVTRRGPASAVKTTGWKNRADVRLVF